MKQKNFYEILGVNKKTPLIDIKSNYRTLAKKHHPDKNIGDKESEDMFKLVGEAYATLSDKEKRKRYDRQVAKYGYGTVKNGAGEEVKYEVKTPSAVASEILGAILGASRGATQRITNVAEEIKDKINNTKQPKRGDNIEANIEITIEEGYFGVEKKLTLKTKNGGVKNVTVDVPRGIRDGEKIRLAALGKPGKNGGKSGDLIIQAKLKEHDILKMDGADIKMNIDISYAASMVGDDIRIKVFGEILKINIPIKTKQGDKLIVQGKGYFVNNTIRGNLVLIVNIIVPEEITTREMKIYEQLLKVEKQRYKEQISKI